MRIVPRATLRYCLCWLLLAFVPVGRLRAQDAGNVPNPNDKQGISAFLSSIAQGIYKLAWPTATFRDFSLDGIEPAEGGFNILVTLDGQSGLDQSDLWVQLALIVRNGGLQDFKVRNDNHILVPPFATTSALASAAAEMAKEYAAQQQANSTQPTQAPAPQADTPSEALPDPYPTPHFAPTAPQTPAPSVQPAPRPTPPSAGQMQPRQAQPGPAQPPMRQIEAEGTCLVNSTGHNLTFDYRWGALKWIKHDLAPNEAVKIWWPYRDQPGPSPALAIRYDDDFAPGYTERDYNLLRTPTALPFTCEQVQNYRFTMEGSKISVYTMTR